MTNLPIGEVARMAGVQPSALRFYERAGVIPKPTRVNGQRRYGADLVRLIEIARFAQSVGFTLEEIRVLFSRPGSKTVSQRWRPLATAKVKQLDEIVVRARQMKKAIEAGLACGCIRVEDCAPAARHPVERSPGSARRKTTKS